jgi:hypothetical protein
MDDPLNLVYDKLKESDSDEATLRLWKEILEWYNVGGPDHLQSNLQRKFKDIKSHFLKSVREVEPDIKAPRRKLKKRKAKS